MDEEFRKSRFKNPAPCPVCQGRGLKKITYPVYKSATTKEMRETEVSCSQCWGWGFVEAGSLDETCIHEFKEVPNKGVKASWTCYHTSECTKCGTTREYDSSG